MRNEPPESGLGGASDPINSYLPRENADKDITEAVTTAFFLDPDLNQDDFSVKTTNGVVYLAGETKSDELRQKAIEVTKAIDGVTDVVATIAVEQ